jgi:hypothetical protein
MFEMMHNAIHQIFDPLEQLLVSFGLGFPELSTVTFVVIVCISIPWINIFRRAGYPDYMGYLMLIPGVNVFVFLRFAFGEWPIDRERRKVGSPSSWDVY